VPLRFHLDEHISPVLADALRHRGIDVTTTADAGLAGAGDREHLAFASKAGRVVVKHDVDFLRLHDEGLPHAGIVYWRPRTRGLGDVLRRLVLMHAALSPEEFMNRVEYL
jgi:hypothetical protein